MRQHRIAFLKRAFEVEALVQHTVHAHVHTHTLSVQRLHMGKAYVQIQTVHPEAHTTELTTTQQNLNNS